MNARTLVGMALALALSGCSHLSAEDEAPPAATPTPEPAVEEAADDDTARALPVGQPTPMVPMAPPGTAPPPPEGAAEGGDGVYDIEE